MQPTTRRGDLARSGARSTVMDALRVPVTCSALTPGDRSMSKALMLLVAAVFAVVAAPVSATCSCQCVEGVARTACTSVEEAQADPSACGSGPQKVACELPPPSTDAPLRYASPDGAVDCRSARLWDPRSNSYSAVAKVCDLDRDAAAGG
jgi:hypothetical protein